MKSISRFFGRLPSFFSLLAGLVMAVILCLLVGLEDLLVFGFNNGASASNQALYPFALGMILLCLAAGRLVQGKKMFPKGLSLTRRPAVLLAAFHGAMFFVQWVLVRSLWFYAGWDPSVVRDAAIELAKGLPLSQGEYFAMHPTNGPLTLILTIPYWLGLQLGMAEPYVLMPLCGAALINLACLFTTLSLRKLTESSRARAFGFAVTTVFILLSPFCAIPYSDAYAILFPVLALYLYLTLRDGLPKWFWITLVSGIGSTIKPTVLVFWIALLLFAGIRRLAELPWEKGWAKRLVLFALAVFLGLAPQFALQSTANVVLAGEASPEGQLTISHFLMMGLNQKTYGGHDPDDVTFSLSFETLGEREKANYQEAFRRLTSMDILTAARFFSVKIFKAYDSGAFAWNGSFLPVETPRRSDGLSVFLRSIYHTNKPNNAAFISVYQTLWLFLLTLGACAFFLMRKNQPCMPLLGLTILGLTLYLMLFECWPRYLYLYAPFYVISGTLGLQALSRRIFKRG